MQNRIRECRKATGLTLKQLSAQVSVPIATINSYELGTRSQDLAKWERLASALHVSPAYLVGWSDEKG